MIIHYLHLLKIILSTYFLYLTSITYSLLYKYKSDLFPKIQIYKMIYFKKKNSFIFFFSNFEYLYKNTCDKHLFKLKK